MIREAMKSGPVTVAIMDTEPDDDNPLTYFQRREMLWDEFKDEIKYLAIPPISTIGYGRDVGYEFVRIHHDLEDVRASDLRKANPPKPRPEMFNEKERAFFEGFVGMTDIVHETAVEQGFWKDGRQRNQGEAIAEVHSELSEALECLRMDDGPDKNIEALKGVEVQLADAIILLMDLSAGFGWNIAPALIEKARFNKTRGHMHGGKRF